MEGLAIHPIDAQMAEQVLQLFRDCPGYFWMAEGQEANEATVEELLNERPPGTSPDAKHVYGIFWEGSLVGVADLVENYPHPGEWIIGLLLLHPDLRGRGFGKQVHEALVHIAIQGGAEKMRIGVLSQNEPALAFWKHLGYRETSRTEPRLFGKKRSVVVVLHLIF